MEGGESPACNIYFLIVRGAIYEQGHYFDRTTYGAKVIGFCKNEDLAMLRAVEL